MKKFFEKHDLFKIAGIMMLFTALLTWVFKYAVFNGAELMTFDQEVKGLASILDTSTIGLFDFNTYALLVLYYFTNIFVFVFVVFAFYKVLGKSNVYNSLVEKVAGLFKGKELLLTVISLVFYTALTSVATNHLIGLVFVPFTISLFAKLKTDKISTLISSFGGMLVGALGATYSTTIVGAMIDYAGLNIKLGYEALSVIVMAVLAIVILTGLVYSRMKTGKKLEVTNDLFIEVEETKKKKHYNIIPLAISLCVFAIVIILAFMPWEGWNVTTFTNLHKSITEATILGGAYPIVFLGSQTLLPLGQWDLFTASSFVIMTMLVASFISGVKFNSIIEGAAEGVKLSVKPVILLAMVFTVLVFSVSFPVIPQFMNVINGMAKVEFLKPLSYFLNGVLASTFAVDMQYISRIAGGLFTTFDNANVAALSLQAGYAFAGFIAPTSALLMLGLSTLDIKFKDYFKFIWKFLIALAVIILIVLYILLYI